MIALIYEYNGLYEGDEVAVQFLVGFMPEADNRYVLTTGSRSTTKPGEALSDFVLSSDPNLRFVHAAAEPLLISAELLNGDAPTREMEPALASAKQQIRSRLDGGFTFVAKVEVNANGTVVEYLESGDEQPPENRTTMSWMLHPPKDKASIPLRKGFILGVFRECAASGALEFSYGKAVPDDPDHDSSGMLPNVLMDTGVFTLKVEKSLDENVIDPDTLEGGGEITAAHGHKPLLMMLYLQKRWREELNVSEGDAIELCDSEANIFSFTRWDSLLPVLEAFGFDENKVRQDAEAIGLVNKLVRLDLIEDEAIEDYFF